MASKDDFVFVLSLAVILVCIAILGLKFTGYASSTANFNLSVGPVVNLNFSVSSIDFGLGQVSPGRDYAVVDSTGKVENGTWDASTQGFVLRNVGNTNISVDLRTDKNADDFIGGSSPTYEYNVTNINLSCISSITLGQWYNVNTSSPGTRICDKFLKYSGNNSIRIDVRLTIPYDSRKGTQSDIFTATGTIA